MIRLLLLVFLTLFSAAPQACAQTAIDSVAIRQTALDYIEGWYTGDHERMAQAVHTHLVKRIVATHPKTGEQVFRDQDSTALVTATKKGYGTKIPDAKRQKDVTILDVFEGAASVKIVAADWVDYLHLVKQDGKWKIINVLWEKRPRRGSAGP
jgi:hypothetical protein